MNFIKQHWVSMAMLLTGILYSSSGLDVQATVCGVGALIHLKLEEVCP